LNRWRDALLLPAEQRAGVSPLDQLTHHLVELQDRVAGVRVRLVWRPDPLSDPQPLHAGRRRDVDVRLAGQAQLAQDVGRGDLLGRVGQPYHVTGAGHGLDRRGSRRRRRHRHVRRDASRRH
jgi:hypothetical protein